MSEQEEVFKNFQDMSVTDKDINILILGETGVGKSTFVNSLANYLEYDKFQVAEENKVRCLIPAKFIVTNENLEEKLVEIGKDSNENNTMYESATLKTRSYVLLSDKVERIRLIDTPGIGDVNGIDRDNENMENILSYISHIEHLHAICFLLKPNNTRLTVMFHYCIKQLLSRLEKSASKNIIFLFTNTRSTFYKPGDTTAVLRKVLSDIKEKPPYTEIKFTKDNVFCLDNESFRYLVAVKNGIELGNKNSFVESWTYSVKECRRMIDFITGKGDSDIKILPHKVKDTVCVNEARKVVLQLSQPLADIADLINDNITVLEKHNKSLQTDNVSIAQLQENLYVPVVNLRCKELSKPTTVCTTYECCELYMVHNIKKYHYKQRCHDPCYLKMVPKEQIGSPELVRCSAMANRKCIKCGCDFSTHMHIYYISETFEDRIDNEGVKAQIKDRQTAQRETNKIIDKIVAMKLDYEKEKDVIIKTMAKFAHFLQCNAIAPYNDSYKAYVDYLIDREKSLGTDCDLNVLKHYNDLLKRYEEERGILEKASSSHAGSNTSITAGFVFDSVQNLFLLPHTGKKIQELYAQQSQNQRKEHKNTEIVLEDYRPRHVQQNKQDCQNKKMNVSNGSNLKKKKKPKNKRNKSNSNNQQMFNMKGFGQNEQNLNNSVYQTSFPAPYHTYQQPHPSHWENYHYEHPQSEFSNFTSNQENSPNYVAQYGNFLRQSSSSRNKNFLESDKQFFSRNDFDKPSTNDHKTGLSNRDSNFDKWYKSMVGGNNTNFSEQTKRGANFSPVQDNDSSSDSNQGVSTQSDDNTDDNKTFKDFMIKNNLEYFVKTPGSNSCSISKEKYRNNSDGSTTKDGKMYSHEFARNMDVNNSTKPSSAKNKSFLSNFLEML